MWLSTIPVAPSAAETNIVFVQREGSFGVPQHTDELHHRIMLCETIGIHNSPAKGPIWIADSRPGIESGGDWHIRRRNYLLDESGLLAGLSDEQFKPQARTQMMETKHPVGVCNRAVATIRVAARAEQTVTGRRTRVIYHHRCVHNRVACRVENFSGDLELIRAQRTIATVHAKQ